MKRGYYILQNEEIADRPFLAFAVPSDEVPAMLVMTLGRDHTGFIAGNGMIGFDEFEIMYVDHLTTWPALETFMRDMLRDVMRAPLSPEVALIAGVVLEFFKTCKRQNDTESIIERAGVAPAKEVRWFAEIPPFTMTNEPEPVPDFITELWFT